MDRVCDWCGSDDDVNRVVFSGGGPFRQSYAEHLCAGCYKKVLWRNGQGDRNVVYALALALVFGFTAIAIAVGVIRDQFGH
ncbi:hypothetical protein [Limnoglobus roseus]|uniref:Uncharacterized protein n=1 Tax=Limnoglobus roseus TaxID=2598579 RepID=A0A5C1A6C9_9BACT|nr:hypothetical protein [Limnoglobus roseus]QEL14270.1 hypothetical protein PX52LOC_01140 [Limnoglobus roseus]